jgi:hypothetical protein
MHYIANVPTSIFLKLYIIVQHQYKCQNKSQCQGKQRHDTFIATEIRIKNINIKLNDFKRDMRLSAAPALPSAGYTASWLRYRAIARYASPFFTSHTTFHI